MVQDSSLACSASRWTDSRNVGAFNARARNSNSLVTSRPVRAATYTRRAT